MTFNNSNSQNDTENENGVTLKFRQCWIAGRRGPILFFSWKCDGVPDCDDGSDEAPSLCGIGENKNSSVSCDTTHGGFLCKDSTACLPAAKVCDTNPDCQDKSDEEDYCSTTKSCSSHGCEQVSIQLSNITKGPSMDR